MTISKILIVEDDEDIRTVIEVVARLVGDWQVLLAASGAEALERAKSEQPDVILLDVMMAGMDGPETLARLRQQTSTARIPVIFLTAKAQKHEVQSYLALGANGVIIKPFEAMTLPDEIRRILADD